MDFIQYKMNVYAYKDLCLYALPKHCDRLCWTLNEIVKKPMCHKCEVYIDEFLLQWNKIYQRNKATLRSYHFLRSTLIEIIRWGFGAKSPPLVLNRGCPHLTLF